MVPRLLAIYDMKAYIEPWLVQVSQLANYLKSIGVKKGSDVTIYMPMIPELPAAMVRCHGIIN